MLSTVYSQKLLKRRIVRQFVKFSIVGVLNLAVDAGIYYGLTRFFSVGLIEAKVISAILAIFNSFAWNRQWTFRAHEDKIHHQFMRFGLVQGVGFAVNAGSFAAALRIFHLSELMSFGVAIIMVTFWNFVMNKWWAFRK